MNIFSNIGVTELIIILLLALIVVGPERLPEMAQKLARLLRDLRKIYENLSRDLGPELASIQRSTQELRASVDAVRSIPQDMVKTMVGVAELDVPLADLKGMADAIQETTNVASVAQEALKHPLATAADAARQALLSKPPLPLDEGVAQESVPAKTTAVSIDVSSPAHE